MRKIERDDKGKFVLGSMVGSSNHKWKGDKVSYGALHDWVSYHKGRPKLCEHCGIAEHSDPRYFEWASISKKYKRDLDDWIRLCKKCHTKYDDRTRGLREYSKRPIKKALGSKSGYKNVRITKEGRYRAYISINKKQIHLGNFDTGEQAFEAYKKKALEVYGYY